ncbi:MAG: class I SAM-dependent methyltransferase, partial [Fibrobacter sp.]|nr:class I SAM-dependent methyltransferase [Fibrobacter sp.]
MQLPPYFKLADLYDQDWGDWSLQHLPLLKNILHRYCPVNAKILDLACGTGVLVQKLAHLGYWVMGIDVSPQMIKVAKAKAGSNTFFEVHDMLDFRTEIKFDLVTCTFDALNYLSSNEELKTVLMNVHGLLNAGGLFMFDMNTEKLFKYFHRGVTHRNINGEEFIQYRNYDALTK